MRTYYFSFASWPRCSLSGIRLQFLCPCLPPYRPLGPGRWCNGFCWWAHRYALPIWVCHLVKVSDKRCLWKQTIRVHNGLPLTHTTLDLVRCDRQSNSELGFKAAHSQGATPEWLCQQQLLLHPCATVTYHYQFWVLGIMVVKVHLRPALCIWQTVLSEHGPVLTDTARQTSFQNRLNLVDLINDFKLMDWPDYPGLRRMRPTLKSWYHAVNDEEAVGECFEELTSAILEVKVIFAPKCQPWGCLLHPPMFLMKRAWRSHCRGNGKLRFTSLCTPH